MAFLSEAAGYLLAALLLGILVGWLFWGDQPFEVASATVGEVDQEAVLELSSQVETRDQEIVRLRKRLKRMHADLDARDSNVDASKRQVEELQVLLAERENVAAGAASLHLPAGSGLAEFSQSEQMTVRRLAELEEELVAAQSELASAKSLSGGNASESAERLGRAEAKNAELERAYAALSEELADTQAQLDEAMNRAAASTQADSDVTELAKLRQDLVASTAKLGQAQRANEVAQQEASQLGADLDSVSVDLQAAQQQVLSLEAELASALAAGSSRFPDGNAIGSHEENSAVSQEIQLELTKVQTELARSRQSVGSLRQRLQEVEDENELLAGDLAKAKSDLAVRQTRAAENEQSTAKLQDDLATSKTKFNEAEAQFLRVNAEVQRLQAGVLGLDQRAAQAESERDELLTTTEQTRIQNESSLSSLQVELSDARLRADAAYDALQELTQEFVSFRDSTQRQQTTMLALADRIDRARSTLVGRSAPLPPSDEEPPEDDLSRLPNMTTVLSEHLREIGVTSYGEIAQWTPADLSRIGSMIGETGPSLEARGWVGAARILLNPPGH